MKKLFVLLALMIFISACSSTTSQVQSTKDNAWCVKGSTYGQQGISSTIDGIAKYKGAEFCKARAVLTGEGPTLEYTYYFNQDGTDVWVIVSQDGQTTETHLTR